MRLLREEAGRSTSSSITDLFERITLWDLRVVGSRRAGGRRQVARAHRRARPASSIADGSGGEKEAPLDQAIDIGLFTADPRRREFSAKDVIALEKRRIVGGKQSIELVVDRKPAFVGIDPYIKLIQRNTGSNVAPLASAASK